MRKDPSRSRDRKFMHLVRVEGFVLLSRRMGHPAVGAVEVTSYSHTLNEERDIDEMQSVVGRIVETSPIVHDRFMSELYTWAITLSSH